MTQLERELLRVYVEAEGLVAERFDPADTMTADEVVRLHRDALRSAFHELVSRDVVIGDLLWAKVVV